jgi:hypothetical protein
LFRPQNTTNTSIMLVEFGKFPFEHFAWGQAMFYYNCVSMVTKDHILGKAWEAQLAMLAAGNKCWARSVKKWLLKNQPQKVASFLPLVQPLLEMTPQPTSTRVLQVEELATAHDLQVKKLETTCAFQARIVQRPLGTTLGTTHIHPTHLTWVRGWAKNQVLWCNVHNVQVGAQMAELAALQLMQPVGARSMAKGLTNQEGGPHPLQVFPTKC